MSSPDATINMKTSGDHGISIQNYGHIHLTIISDGEKEVRSKRKRKSKERDSTPDVDGPVRGKRYK